MENVAATMAQADTGRATSGGMPATVSMPNWMQSSQSSRYWEAAETTRLNSAHWSHAEDSSINVWLAEHLQTLRTRSIYESRQNGIVLGMQNSHADDIVGQDGPTLQVLSDNKGYNDALEAVWRDWFKAPTQRANVSGASLLKLWVRNLWRCGEFLARVATIPDMDDPVAMRLIPIHPRRLATPATAIGDQNTIMGIRFDRYSRPAQYWVQDQAGLGVGASTMTSTPYPPDLIVHEFMIEEEDQARGVPLCATGLNTSADLRDYDDQVQDAARSIADQSALLYTDHPEAKLYDVPESATIERRTIRMVPPGWKPFIYTASQPPVQYPEYRSERQIELGRPVSMPRLMVRLDASKHSWASARLDMTTYRRAVAGFQAWLSGSDKAVGVLSRLVAEVAREARFSVPQLRETPRNVVLHWTWPQIDEIEPAKTAKANETDLNTGIKTETEILAARKKTLAAHIEEKRREREAYAEAGVPYPERTATGGGTNADADDDDDDDDPVETEEAKTGVKAGT